MNFNLNGKKVLVTGSTHGIGYQIASAFLLEGCSVAFNARNNNKIDINNKENAYFVAGDVTIDDEAVNVVNEAAKKMGGLDIVVCNVGSGQSASPGKETTKDWHESIKKNFYSTVHVVQAARPHLINSQGVIICISSICGLEVIPKAPVTYSVAKAALNSYVKGMSRPLGNDGIRICAVAPGNIMFDGSVWDKKVRANQEEVELMLYRDVPLKKLGTSSDVSNLVLFISSSLSVNITGSIFVSDGGQIRSI
jgi:3-oxoacyl-[acyl-carrier protein] reductase